MSNPTSTEQRKNALLLIVALGGISASLAAAFGALGLALVSMVQRDTEPALGALWWAAGLLVVGLCGVPLAYWSGRGLFGLPAPAPARPSRRWAWIALLFPAAIGLGYLAFAQKVAPQILAPTAQILAAGIPVALIALLARRLAPPVTARRAWAQFLLGVWVTPAVALALEVMTLIPLSLFVAVGLMLTPQGLGLLRVLTESPTPTLEQIAPSDLVLGQPWLVVVLLLFAALLVPLVEEALKTISVWPFLRKTITPGEAFLGGVLCGAGYALFEALFLPQPGSEWAITMVSRVGTTLVHAFGAGITSLGLVNAVARQRPWRVLPPYLGAVALHGLWNATVIGMGVGTLVLPEIADGSVRQWVEPLVNTIGPGVLLGLSLTALVGIVGVARRLRKGGEAREPVAAS